MITDLPPSIGWLLVAGWAVSCLYGIIMVGVWKEVSQRRIFAAVVIGGTLLSVFWINRGNPALVDRTWLTYSLYAISTLTVLRAIREFFPPSWQRSPVGTSRLEQFILIVLDEQPRYGFTAIKRMEELGGGHPAISTFYLALGRLVDADMVEAAGTIPAETNGEPRKAYRTTAKGKAMISAPDARQVLT